MHPDARFILFVLAAVVIFYLGGLAAGYLIRSRKVARQLAQLEYYQQTYQWRSGWAERFGSYRLLSFDGGKGWYATDQDNKILGEAEVVHPGLLQHLAAMERLTGYVAEHGPIDLADPRQVEILTAPGTGFTIKREPAPTQ